MEGNADTKSLQTLSRVIESVYARDFEVALDKSTPELKITLRKEPLPKSEVQRMRLENVLEELDENDLKYKKAQDGSIRILPI